MLYLASVSTLAQSLPEGPAAVASYTLEARLNTDEKRVYGQGTITWKNPTEHPAEELFFHLYMNGFRNTDSSWLRREGLEEAEILDRRGWGWIEVTTLRDEQSGEDLLPGLAFVDPRAAPGADPSPDHPDDRTVARVPLGEPVLPGQERSFSIRFETRLPWIVSRTGFANDYFLVAQWFPKLGVFEADGTWVCPPFSYSGEFYADFGDYDVTLVVPEGFRVGATGRETETREGDDGTVRHRYVQAGVHDFAWTAWPHFVDLTRTFHHPRLPQVEIRLLLRPENRGKAERYFTALEHALTWFGPWYGPYPYETLTMVDPPWAGGASGGMEYPTFITTGSHLFSPLPTLSPEEVTIHELGHQYFYGLVATNEIAEPYLDEGITTYAADRVLRRLYPRQAWSFRVWDLPVVFPGVRLDTPLDTSADYFRHATEDPITRTSWGYRDSLTYGVMSYSKMALVLAQIERTVGPEAMERAMRAYATAGRFRHPRTEDFLETLNRETEVDLTPHFRQLFFGSGVLDYAVAEAVTAPAWGPFGVFGEGEGRRTEAGEALPGFVSEVLVERRGEVRLPVTVELTFADGRRERRSWDGEQRWVRYRIRGPKLLAAEVDPDEILLLDIDRLNNSRRTEPDGRAARRWGQHLRFWIQNFLETVLTLA